MHPYMAYDLVAQHITETQTAATTARLTSAVRAARRSSTRIAGTRTHRHWIARRA
jgi:hypothetical protein